MSINKAMVMCIIKPHASWHDIGETSECLRDISRTIKDIEEEGYHLYSQKFSSGSQSHEKIAFVFMTTLDNEGIYNLFNKKCGQYYDIHILN